MKKEMKLQMRMISAVSRVLDYHKENPNSIDEEIFQDLADYISSQGINNEKIIRAMIASASIAVKLRRKSTESEGKILEKVMSDIPRIVEEIEG